MCFIFLLLVGVVLLDHETYTEGLKVQNKSLSSEYNSKCIQLAKPLYIVSVIFCNVHPEDSIVKDVMEVGSTTTLGVSKADTGDLAKVSYTSFMDFLIFTDTDTGNLVEKCVSESVPQFTLKYEANLVICDKSTKDPDIFLEEDSLGFLGSANIMYVTRLGCWRASPPHQLRRSLSRERKCEWMSTPQSLAVMQGQLVRAATLERVMSTITNKGETEPQKRYDGLEFLLFFDMARVLNFSWEIEEINDDEMWGHFKNGTWHGGLFGALTSGGSDVGLAMMKWDEKVTKYVHFTAPWAYRTCVFVVPRPVKIGIQWDSFFRSFSWVMWIAVITAVILFPATAWTLDQLHTKYIRKLGLERLSLVHYYLYTLGTLTGGSSLLGGRRREVPLRWLIAWWFFFVILITNSYTSNIVANITTPSYTPMINTVRQLVEQNFSWGKTKFYGKPDDYLNIQKYWPARFLDNLIYYNASEERGLLLSQKFALLAVTIDGTENLMVEQPLDKKILHDMIVMKESLNIFQCSMALRPFSPLHPLFNQAIARLSEVGVLLGIKRSVFMKYQNRLYRSLFKRSNSLSESEKDGITLQMLRYVFRVLVAGWFVSFLCFMLEMYIYRRNLPGIPFTL